MKKSEQPITPQTIEEHLKLLPEPYRKQALENHKNYTFGKSLKHEVYTLHQAIGAAFVWRESPQGEEYWSKAAESIISGKTPPSQPFPSTPWISVNDNLPDPNIEVYVLYSPRSPIMEGTTWGIMRRITHKTAVPIKLDPNGFATGGGGIVHYWMPVPERPKPFVPAKEIEE